ncbi:MAG TPA: ABC transporter permease [Streptosporangiaceae bacterium]
MNKGFGIALGNEVRKGLLFAWSERLQILIELPMFAIFILLLGPLLGQGKQLAAGDVSWSLSSARTSVLVVWIIPFIFFYMQIIKMFWRLLGEIQTGTIEQVYLSPMPSWLVVATGRATAALLETIVVAGATYGIVSVFVPLHIGWHLAALLPAALIMVTAVGVSLMVAGATLVWKRTQLVNDTLLLIVFVFSSAAVPLIGVPRWWADVGRVFPLTNGVASLFRVLLLGRSATSPWGIGGLVWVVVTSAAYFGAGILVLRQAERTAKRRGSLGRY